MNIPLRPLSFRALLYSTLTIIISFIFYVNLSFLGNRCFWCCVLIFNVFVLLMRKFIVLNKWVPWRKLLRILGWNKGPGILNYFWVRMLFDGLQMFPTLTPFLLEGHCCCFERLEKWRAKPNSFAQGKAHLWPVAWKKL